MDKQQFRQILKSDEPRYTAGIPIIVESYALMKDKKTGEVLAQIIFRNISETRTHDLAIDITCRNADSEKTKGVFGYSYFEPYYKRDQKFGMDVFILLPDASTRSIEINIKKATFIDGSEKRAQENSLKTPEQRRLVDYFEDDRIAKQYVREANNIAFFVAEEFNDLWLCSCGAYNSKHELKCHVCLITLDRLKALLSTDILKPRLAEYEKKQAELKIKQAGVKRLQELKIAKTRKMIKILAPVGALILAVVIVWVAMIIPLNKYNDAMDMLEEGY